MKQTADFRLFPKSFKVKHDTFNIGNLGQYHVREQKNNILLGIFILLFLYQLRCSGSNEVLAENVAIKRQAEMHLNNAKMFEEKNIALQKDYEILEDSIKTYKENEKKLIASREVIKEKKVAKTTKIKKYNSSQIAIHTQERYGVDSAKVKTTPEGTIIKDDVMIDLLVEVEEGDY